jgi:conjugative relaxase-like TrwC/TraI family protein
MMRITQSRDAANAKSYYANLSKNDYYSERGDLAEVAGLWGGKVAERLGLSGVVDKERFDLLCDNIDPNTHKNLTARFKKDRRCGYDFTFDLSKKASLYYAMTRDERVMTAFDEAIQETMAELEADTRTRVRVEGQNDVRVSACMLWASFDHATARPVNGIPDPHIHRHVYVFNVTYDQVEQRFKALDISTIKKESVYWQEVFHSRVAAKLRAAGINTERTTENYDLAGLSKETALKFSRRTEEIEKIASERGITDDIVKSGLGATTRSKKTKDLSMAELRQEWDGRLTDAERKMMGTIAWGQAQAKTPDVSAAQSVDWALEHCFERNSVALERRVLAEALKHGLGSATVEEIRAEFERRPEILTREVDGQRLTTTRQVLEEERTMISWAREGRGTCSRLVGTDRPIADEKLSQEQREAVRHIWESTDRVILVRGAAGTGKTTLLKATVEGIEAEGTRVFAFAPSADASRGVQRAEGFADATTVAALLSDEKLQDRVQGSVIWVDEAGTLGVRSMNQLFELAEAKQARILLTGDSAQHGPVDRGDSLSIIEKQSGCESASVVQIRRQKNAEYREAVMALSQGDTEAAFAKLDALGYVREIPGQERHQQLAADYLKAVDAKMSVLCIAPTHRECEAVTREVREGLRQRNKLGKEEHVFQRLKNIHDTEAERRDIVTYRPGQVLQFTQNVPALRRGEKLTVVGLGPDGTVDVRRSTGEVLPLPLRYADKFQRYQTQEVEFSVGDRVRITQNGYDKTGKHRLNNGDDRHTVAGFTRDGGIKLENGWVIPKDFGHMTHGYATTSHSSQGKSVDRVLVAQGSESFTATHREQFYVSVSRGKESVTLYTDNKAQLREEIQESGRRMSAVEMMQDAPEARKERILGHAELNARLKSQAEANAARSFATLQERYGAAPLVGAAREDSTRGGEYER